MPIAPGHRPRSERSHSKSKVSPVRWKVYGPASERGQLKRSPNTAARPPGSVCSNLVPGRIYRQCSTGRCASLPNGREAIQQGHSGPQKSLCVNWRWTAWERLQAPPGVSPLPSVDRKGISRQKTNSPGKPYRRKRSKSPQKLYSAQQNRQQPKPDRGPSTPPGSVFVQFALELLQIRPDLAHRRHP